MSWNGQENACHSRVSSPRNASEGAPGAVYAPEFVGHHPGAPDWIGPESVKVIVRTMRDAFPDFTETIEDVVAEGDRVVTRFTATGTHLGALRGLAPTGRRMSMAEMAVFRVVRGRIVEKWDSSIDSAWSSSSESCRRRGHH